MQAYNGTQIKVVSVLCQNLRERKDTSAVHTCESEFGIRITPQRSELTETLLQIQYVERIWVEKFDFITLKR